MTNRMLRNRCVIGLIVVALLAGCFQLKTYWWEPVTVRAQGDDEDDDLSGGALAVLLLAVGGASASQKVRLSVGNLPAARQTPYAWFYIVRNTRNEVIFRSERIEVPAAEWRYSEVSGQALRTVGGTGEDQVMIQVFLDLPRGGQASSYFGAAEVLDEVTAQTKAYLKFQFSTVFVK